MTHDIPGKTGTDSTKPADNLRMSDLSSNHLALLAWVLGREGMDVEAMFAEVGARVPSSNSPSDRVSVITVIKLLEKVQQQTGDPCAALNLYRSLKLTHLNVLGFALSCSSTLLDFFERLQRFCDYLGSAFLIEAKLCDDHYLVMGRWNPEMYREQLKDTPNSNLLMESLGYSAIGIIQDLFGGQVPIRCLHLPGEPHEKVIAAFSETASAPVKTGEDFIGAEIDLTIMNVRLPGGNPALARENDRLLTEYLATFNEQDIVHRCEQLIIEGMPFGEFSLKQIASKLGTSERVLRQNLQNHGQTFSGVVNRIQKTLAIQHLQENRKNISEIAYLIGFDSPSNFSRAFRNWTGQSPREYKVKNKIQSTDN
ncbi:AraC family transcriptional regulator [Zhongshania arctica]|uniref:AraC family transcriptional regulator ligand-binding domain-containing protein n=1 Tax=Zhongshania arctica TaxID=3238302 RepID=A0ABV3TZN7_9GAMM